ncbi:MAG TPA: hypothetical protein DCZ03_10670 [Gammaproteobacteria bacterium]|nr:hypothetical protein [Gammaproteobacteria bacterium]
MKYRTNGFTLVETMIVLAVAAILVAVAAPSFNQFMINNRTQSTQSFIAATLAQARSEALKQNQHITICNTNRAHSRCRRRNEEWDQFGWIMFVDTNANEQLDGGETILASRQSINGAMAIRLKRTGNRVGVFRFTGAGASANDLTATFVACHNGAVASQFRGVTIAATGRIAATRDIDNDDVHEDHLGNDLSCS